MMSFVVFDADGVDPGQFPPRHMYLVGPDDIPVQGQATAREGQIDCVKEVPHSVGLALQLAIPDPEEGARDGQTLGLLTVQTCLLPDRERPYLLTIELARHQIMFLLNKLEDWGLFDLPPDHPVMQQFEHARQTFTSALVAQKGERQGYSPAADHQAALAAAMAVSAGERAALVQAERQIGQRLSGKGYAAAVEHLKRLTPEVPPPGSAIAIPGSGEVVLPGVPLLGCAVSPGPSAEALQRAVQGSCDFVTMPMRWVDMEPVEGKLAFAATDRWIEWAVRTAKLPVHAGPIIDFRPQCVPEWLYIWENDYETMRDLVMEHLEAIVTRYRRTVQRWTVASGLHVNTNFKISFEQIMDLTRICVLLVRKLHPTGKVQLEIAQPWGEYHATNRRSIPPYLYAEAVVQSGLSVDAIALRLQMGHAEPGLSTRDLMSLSAILDRYAALQKPIVVSALGVPSAGIAPRPYRPRAGAAGEDAYEPGYWRSPWSEAVQADWLTHAAAIICAKPYVQSLCWQEFMDPVTLGGRPAPEAPEMPFGGLVSGAGQPKPSLLRFAQVRQCLKEGRSPLTLLGADARHQPVG